MSFASYFQTPVHRADFRCAGPPTARRASPRGKRIVVGEAAERSISRHRPSKLSFQPRATSAQKSPVITELDDPFRVPPAPRSAAPSDAASATSTTANKAEVIPATPSKRKGKPRQESSKASSPALTARRRIRNVFPLPTDPSKLSLDEALTALEHHSAHPDSSELSSWELEDAYVRRFVALRRALKNAMASGELIEATSIDVAPQSEKTIYVGPCPVLSDGSLIRHPVPDPRPSGRNSHHCRRQLAQAGRQNLHPSSLLRDPDHGSASLRSGDSCCRHSRP